MTNYNGYVDKESYLISEKLVKERNDQITGYRDGERLFKHNRDFYKTVGLILGIAAWIISYLDTPLGIMIFGITLFVYFGGPSQHARKTYLYEIIEWEQKYTWRDYEEGKCPDCGAAVRAEHHLVTYCPACNLQMCKFGAELRTAGQQELRKN